MIASFLLLSLVVAAVSALHPHAMYYVAPGDTLPPSFDDDGKFADDGGPADFVLWSTRWPGAPGSVSVTYSFATVTYETDQGFTDNNSNDCTPLGGFMPPGHEDEIRRALAAWSAVADITFVEEPDNGLAGNLNAAAAQIRFCGQDIDGNGNPNTLAHAFFPGNALGLWGDVHFDSGNTWQIGFAGPGIDIFQVAAHEIGHAIGLRHEPAPPMGNQALMNPIYSTAFSGLLQDDINGAQALYGGTW